MSHQQTLEIIQQLNFDSILLRQTLENLNNKDVIWSIEDYNAAKYQGLIKFLLNNLLEKNATSLHVYISNTCKMNFEFVIIVSASSTRNAIAIADHVMQSLKDFGLSSKAEGLTQGQWISINHDSLFAVNILTPIAEEYFQLIRLYNKRKEKTLLEISNNNDINNDI